jgi:hypothetical protein
MIVSLKLVFGNRYQGNKLYWIEVLSDEAMIRTLGSCQFLCFIV